MVKVNENLPLNGQSIVSFEKIGKLAERLVTLIKEGLSSITQIFITKVYNYGDQVSKDDMPKLIGKDHYAADLLFKFTQVDYKPENILRDDYKRNIRTVNGSG